MRSADCAHTTGTTSTSTTRPNSISHADVDDFLADIDALAEVVWLCGEGADHVALIGNGKAFAAIRQAFEDRTNTFRRDHGMLDEAAAGERP